MFPVTICITACQSGLFETSYRLFHCFLLPAASQHASLGCFTLRPVTGCSLFPVIICITACQSGLFHIETSYRLFHCFLLPSASQHASLGCFTLGLVTGCSLFPVTTASQHGSLGCLRLVTGCSLFPVTTASQHGSLGCFTLRLVTGCSLFPVTICITACQSGLFETSYRLFHCFLLPSASQHASLGCLRLVTGCSLFPVTICITACQSGLFHIETSYRLFHCFLLSSASQHASLGCFTLNLVTLTGFSIVFCYLVTTHHFLLAFRSTA